MQLPRTLTPLELWTAIRSLEPPIILDVTSDEDFNEDPHLIPTATRMPHRAIQLMEPLTQSTYVFVCQKGRKLSQGAAAMLSNAGTDTSILDGGNIAWRESGMMRVKPPVQAVNGLVTTDTIDFHTLFPIWLARRFLNPELKILRVDECVVDDVAEKFGLLALPFNAEPRQFMEEWFDEPNVSILAMASRTDAEGLPSQFLDELLRGAAKQINKELDWLNLALQMIDSLCIAVDADTTLAEV